MGKVVRHLFHVLFVIAIVRNVRCFLDNEQESDVSAVKMRLEEEREKHILLQNDVDMLMLKVGRMSKIIDNLDQERTLPMWESWASWSNCFWNCSGDNGGRMQTRTRARCSEDDTCNKNKKCSETESRPCNAVQFEGCKVSGEGDNLSGLAYNYYDQMAQSICTAVNGKSNFINAVRRHCARDSTSCNDICSELGRECFNTVHVYRNRPVLQDGTVGVIGLQTYIYHTGCTSTGCGPNFCCCRK